MIKIQKTGSVCVSELRFLSLGEKSPEILNRKKKTELDITSHFPSFILLLLLGMFSGAASGLSPPTGRMTQPRAVIMFKPTDSAHFLPAELEQSVQESGRMLLSCGRRALQRVGRPPACDHLLKGSGVI